MENNKIIPLKQIVDEKVKKKLKNLNSLYNTEFQRIGKL